MTVIIDGYEFEDASLDESHGCGITLRTGSVEFVLFEDRDKAGEAAREYWEDMAEYEPSEFRIIVGDEALVSWALGMSYAVGSVAASSLCDWLDLWLGCPEEHWASYDGAEIEGIEFDSEESLREFEDILGWDAGYTVAYRIN